LKRIYLIIISFFLFFEKTLYCQENDLLSITLEYYNKSLYFVGDSDNYPILVHVSISNTSGKTARFKIADDKMFSLDFVGITKENISLPSTSNLERKRTTHQTVYFKEIVLEPGEHYSFVENLKDYITIEKPGVYYFSLLFYPELYKFSNISLESNRLILNVKPTPEKKQQYQTFTDSPATILKPEAISADKVVEQTIIARQKNLWEQYFLYIDVEQMLMRDPLRNKKYRMSSEAERQAMIEEYKLNLIQQRIDTEIVAVPEKFVIERTLYTQTEGTVSVIQWFKYNTFREKKRYTYYIRQRDGIWQIYDYDVENLGTE